MLCDVILWIYIKLVLYFEIIYNVVCFDFFIEDKINFVFLCFFNVNKN